MTALTDTAITIRIATEDDALTLRRLAELDGARLPEGELLVAEIDGEIRAALRIQDSSSACSTPARRRSAARRTPATTAPARACRSGARCCTAPPSRD